MCSGRLHIAGFSTGPTPFAVNFAGAVPSARTVGRLPLTAGSQSAPCPQARSASFYSDVPERHGVYRRGAG
jgi:hypothetical protein